MGKGTFNSLTALLESESRLSACTKFCLWLGEIHREQSVFLVDGIVSFARPCLSNVTYVAARSPSCDIGWMKTSPNRRDRWLTVWDKKEALSYATQVGVPNAAAVIDQNFLHLGGVIRFALRPKEAEEAVRIAFQEVDATELFKLVETGWTAKLENQEMVDRLIHRHPPPGRGIGLEGASFTFASDYVSKKVAMSFALETRIETRRLSDKYKTVGVAGALRGVLFEADAARRIAEGGRFPIKQLGTQSEDKSFKSPIVQIDGKTKYPPSELMCKFVWSHPNVHVCHQLICSN